MKTTKLIIAGLVLFGSPSFAGEFDARAKEERPHQSAFAVEKDSSCLDKSKASESRVAEKVVLYRGLGAFGGF